MFLALYCEPLPFLLKLCPWRPNKAPLRISLVLFVEVLHPDYFVNITDVKSMLSYTFINSYSQVSDPGPKGPLVV